MKIMKKISNLFLAVCLVIPCFSLSVYAANGTITFSDPTTAVGEQVTVNVKMNASGKPIGDGTINVTYDATALEFIDGENAKGGNGSVALFATGDGNATELTYIMNFKALKEGETVIEVADSKAFLYNNESLDLTLGNSKVTIGPGDGTTQVENVSTAGAVAVTVDGKKYTISESFTDLEIPLGFSKTTLMYEGADRQVLVQDASGQYLIYLQGEDGKSEFFFYVPDTDTFSPYAQVDISDKAYIMITNKSGKNTLPKVYQKTTVDIGGKEFGAWQNTEDASFYLVYALNSEGKTGYYRYDTVDGTYQRFTVPTEKKEDAKATGLLGKIQNLVDKYLTYVLIGAWIIFIGLFILIIVISIKLRHRNQELDDIYDEYGDEEYEKGVETEGKKAVNVFKRHQGNLDDFEDDFNDLHEENFDLGNEIFQNTEPSVKTRVKPMKRASAQVDSERKVKKNPNRNVEFKRFDDDDDFSVDFIDFDD
ncbi:cohesin domain-containing protein [Lachnospiraceae bacterium LCP25S3_G4]